MKFAKRIQKHLDKHVNVYGYGVEWWPMSSTVMLALPRNVVERVRKEAERLGVSLEEYVVEALLRDVDPRDRAKEYIEAAKLLLEQAQEELGRGDVRQAAEKVRGACALAIKAYAWWREGRRLSSHGELWEYSEKLVEELGEWVDDAWNAGNSMHTCFYEGWCRKGHIERAIKRVEKLVEEIESRIKASLG